MSVRTRFESFFRKWVLLIASVLATIFLGVILDKDFSVIDGVLCILVMLTAGLCSKGNIRKLYLRTLHIFVYFTILLVAYYDHSPYPREYLLVPLITAMLVYLYPLKLNIFLIISVGVIGNIFISYDYFITGGVDYISLIIYFVTAIFLICIELSCVQAAKLNETIRVLQNKITHINALNSTLSGQLFSLQKDISLEERRKITKQIHDTAGYVFTNIIMILQATDAVMEVDNDKAKKMISDALDYSRRGINEIRYILREMREDEYGPKSLHNEIYEIAKTFSMASNCKVTIEYGNWPQSFNPDYDIFFIHLVQESLTNSIKHGNAENVSIICWRTSDLISISVSNDGLKAENGEVKFGIGLSGIYEFVTKWNGRMEFPPVQEGFSLLVELPVV